MWLVFVLVQRMEVIIRGGRRRRTHMERGEVWNRVELCGSKVEKTSFIMKGAGRKSWGARLGVLRGGSLFNSFSVVFYGGIN